MSAEGKDINKSMLVLARIIMDLAKRSKKSKASHEFNYSLNREKEKEIVLPWRDSKLTMMLKKCMDGNA